MNKTFFVSFILMLGIILTYLSWHISNDIKNSECTSATLVSANQTIMTIGVVFIVSSLSFFICVTKCKCEDTGDLSMTVYSLISMALGLVLLVLGAVVNGQGSKTACKSVKTFSPMIWGVGVLMILTSGGYLGTRHSNKFKPRQLKF